MIKGYSPRISTVALRADVTNFGRDWQAALDECARWGDTPSLQRVVDGHGGHSFVVVYTDDPHNIEVQE